MRTRSSVAVLVVLLAGCGSEVETTPDDGAGGSGTGPGGTDVAAPSSGAAPTSGQGGEGPATTSGQGGDAVTVGAGGGCDAPLDQETLDLLELTGNGLGPLLGAGATAHPGDSVTFELGIFECCYVFEPVAACAEFSVDDTSVATVDAISGVVDVSASAPHGATVVITADVEDGRRVLSRPLFIWTEEGNPVVGLYTEVGQLDCATGDEVEPPEPIGELRLGADLTFGVTWQPFEVYVDYWGTYTIDAQAQTLELLVEGGNYVPDDIDPAGRFRVDGDRIALQDIWLGQPPNTAQVPQCGHVFQ